MTNQRFWLSAFIVCMGLLGLAPFASAQDRAPAKARPLEAFDMAAVIRDAANRRAGTMKVGSAQAVRQVDDILASDYGARGRIGAESNARLKLLYTQAAHLLMNSGAIAGGTLIVIARHEPAFARSPCGPAFSAFVDAMLAPTDEGDDVLADYAKRAAKARTVLSKLRPELQMAGQLRVMGAIYDDDVAVDAGTTALKLQQASAAEKAIIDAALQAARAR